MKTNHGALVSNFHNGVPRSYRDRKDIALQSAAVSKVQNPNSVVKLKDLQTGEEIAQAIVSMARSGCSALHHPDKCRCYVAGSKVAGGSQDPRRMFRCGTSPHATMAPSAPADFVSVIDDVPLIDVAGAGVRPVICAIPRAHPDALRAGEEPPPGAGVGPMKSGLSGVMMTENRARNGKLGVIIGALIAVGLAVFLLTGGEHVGKKTVNSDADLPPIAKGQSR